LDFLFLSLFWFAVNLAGGWWRLGGGGVVGDVSSELLRHGGIRPRVILPHISEQNRNDINNLNYFFLSSGWGGVEGGIGAVNEWWKKSQDNFAITVTKPKGKREKKSQKMSNPNNNKNQPNHQIKTKEKKKRENDQTTVSFVFLKNRRILILYI